MTRPMMQVLPKSLIMGTGELSRERKPASVTSKAMITGRATLFTVLTAASKGPRPPELSSCIRL